MTDADELAKRVLRLEAELRELRLQLAVFRTYVLVEIGRQTGDRAVEIAQFLDQKAVELSQDDPVVAAKRQAAEMIEAAQLLRKRDPSGPDS